MKILLIMFYIVSVLQLSATIINIPADQPTIQAGINVTVDGDTVLVQSGTYLENIDFLGKNIVVCSNYLFSNNVEDIDNTIIDGGQNDTVVKFVNNEDSTACIIGFSIINGQATMGGGISCNSSTPVIQYNIIRNNTADIGGGMLAINSSPQIINNTIIDNSNYGIRCLVTDVEMNNCILWNNLPDQILVNNNNEINATYNDIENGWEGMGNIDIDPLFENIGNNEFQLQQISPCKNTGDPHSLCDPDGTRSDMGALYFTNNSIELFADLLVDVTTGHYPLDVHFQDYSEAFNTDITNWSWQFGDGNTSSEVNPFHTYLDIGVYTVSLTVSDGIGNSDSIVLEDFIDVLPGDTLYISLDGSNISGNGSEENPFATIQHAIDLADNGKTLIAFPGTYFENIDFNGKNITVASLFLTTQDTTYISTTVIDGRMGGSVVTFENGETSDAILTGFTLYRGSGTNVSSYYRYGGGIYCIDSSPSIMNTIISNNFANVDGGGVYCVNSNASFVNVTISDNYLQGSYSCGNGVYCYNSDISFVNVTISDNSSVYMGSTGGGIFCGYSNVSLINVSISENTCIGDGAGISCYSSNLNLENVDIIDNSTSGYWGFWADGGGISFRESNNALLENVNIIGNSGITGGGIALRNSSPTLVNVTIAENTAHPYGGYRGLGGGLFCLHSDPVLENVDITNNNAERGGGIYCNDSNPVLTNVTISTNIAQAYNYDAEGGGIRCRINSNPNLTNCILWNNLPEEIFFEEYEENEEYAGSIIISYSDIQNGQQGIVTNNNGTIDWLEGNINESPLFIETGEFPFSLLEDSPCIDAGNPDPIYYDPEDPTNPGYALYPAMGTVINDMGAYGGPNVVGWPVVGLDDNVIVQTPVVFLHQNYPNPFNPTTTINYSLKENSKVSLNIYNIKGQKVKQLVNDQLSIGQHSVIWNGKDDSEKKVSSGVYLYKLNVNGKTEAVKKCLLLK